MGFLNLEYEKIHLKIIKERLRRRGLKPDLEADWEIHGPHPGMNYQVYIGYAYEDNPEDWFLVVIYPHAVYYLWNSSKWYNPSPEDRIYCKRKKVENLR